MTPTVLEIIKINIFFRPEEPMLETDKSLSELLKFKLCLRESLKLHTMEYFGFIEAKLSLPMGPQWFETEGPPTGPAFYRISEEGACYCKHLSY